MNFVDKKKARRFFFIEIVNKRKCIISIQLVDQIQNSYSEEVVALYFSLHTIFTSYCE